MCGWRRNDTLHEMRYESGRATARVAPTERNKKCHGRADVGIGPYGSVTRGTMGGRTEASAPTERNKKCHGRADVGIGPYGEVARGAGKESPSHGFAVPAPFRQGGLRDEGDADCHSQCAHWPRNDTMTHYKKCDTNPTGAAASQ